MNNLKGFAFGILTSATFGLIPLFTLPLMAKGMQFDSILFYRFLFAALEMCIRDRDIDQFIARNDPAIFSLRTYDRKEAQLIRCV